MDYEQIIILIAYIIGFLILFFHQKKLIEPLRQQLKSQSELLLSAEKYMNIFDIARLKSYVEISEKTFRQEKEEAIKKIEEQRNKKVKTIKALQDETLELMTALLMLSSTFAGDSYFEKTINDMKDVTAKPFLLDQINKRKEELEAQDIAPLDWFAQIGKSMQALEPLLKRLEKSFEQKKKPSASLRNKT